MFCLFMAAAYRVFRNGPLRSDCFVYPGYVPIHPGTRAPHTTRTSMRLFQLLTFQFVISQLLHTTFVAAASLPTVSLSNPNEAPIWLSTRNK